ncbi:putative cadmium-transporting ATPase [uncultured Defluviicoccus sp.]|uniref:Putative cadmium-transporting ATPase n=1 Tax=metagenome TaxID=256318 RepID=A0A380T815_9ZZZZ|nr:putative cadmium-transporting ATPase [uncultured Defluviicoccus sp.]
MSRYVSRLAPEGERKAEGSSDEHDHGSGPWELVFAILSGVALAAGWLIESTGNGQIAIAVYTAAYFFGGFFTVKEAIHNLGHGRFEIDTLMVAAAAGAAILGHWSEGALLLCLFSLGHALEGYAMGRARRAIEALGKLAPEVALVRRGDSSEEVPVAQLKLGDIVIVKPNERIPADGVVVVGETSVDQSSVTGESVPVDKRPLGQTPSNADDFGKTPAESKVFAATINGPGAIEVWVARLAGETTLARVVKLVAEAQAQRSPTQKFTDTIERIFVPSVLIGVFLLMFAWTVLDETAQQSFYRAMAVLVAASPCALAISVPSAVLSGIARAGRGGVLIKGGGPLENLGTLKAIAFDKTGTLTEGKPKLTDVMPAEGVEEAELLQHAIAIEQLSDHPLAAAITRDGRDRMGKATELKAEGVEGITGKGVKGRVGGKTIWIGKPGLFDGSNGAALPEALRDKASAMEKDGRTVMIVRRDDQYLGILGVMDTPRPEAREVIAQLKALGVQRMIMLTGDNQSVADAIASTVGLTDAKGGLMPEDKVEAIQALVDAEGKVAMLGDGVNDAPALAKATVGVAMGAAGSDVALETADIALMADDLSNLPFAVGLSRQTSAIIKQNLFVSLGVVAVLIPSTLLGLQIGAAIIFHEGSTLLVVINALRLLAYRGKESGSSRAAAAVPHGAT